jgi:HPt (histidine-containing phosphotransfer) domain-containing protein
MAQLAIKTVDKAPASALEPAEPIDRAHLARMTFGDRSLEREVLQLFDRQAEILIDRMRSSDAAAVGALAHTLKGSAASVGAVSVAAAAAAVEQAATASARGLAIEKLDLAVGAVRAAIGDMLRAA